MVKSLALGQKECCGVHGIWNSCAAAKKRHCPCIMGSASFSIKSVTSLRAVKKTSPAVAQKSASKKPLRKKDEGDDYAGILPY